jgi:CubicO group peptidase (beta-lactamase class C family)
MLNRKLFTVIILSFFTLLSYAQRTMLKENRAKLKSEIDSILQSQVDQDKIPGAVVLIKKDNTVIYRHAYGYAQKYDFNHNLLSPPEKMKVNTLFDIASLTKVIGTATAVMLLADRGQINIDDPVCKYIKAFNTPDKAEITIRHLLTHTAGLYEWYPLYYLASNKQECFRTIESLPLMFPVGEQRRYSDLGFVLLGEIIEIVSGVPLEKFMKQNIFQPLGMKNTTFNPLPSGGPAKIAATSAGNPYERRMVYDSTLGFKIKEIEPEQWNGWRTYILI